MIATLPSGLRIAYDESGSGAALLLVHGWPHDRTLWHGQVSGLATHARCIAPDLRGFGGSDVTGPISIDLLADDLAGLLDALAIPEAVICGLSMGGYVAMAMCRRHRPRVRALVLTSTRATADSAEGRAARERIIELVARDGMQVLAEGQLERMAGRATLESRPHLRDALRSMMAAAPAAGVTGAQRAMMERPDSSAMLAALDVPVLVIAGAEDAIIPAAEQRAMASSIPGARYVEIAGAGHVCAFERAGVFNHAVAEFLDGL